MGALWAAAIVGVASVAVGASQNATARKDNQAAQDLARTDYATRLQAALSGAQILNTQYNEIVNDRPDLTWANFVRDKIRAIDDPVLREVYTKAKDKDFEGLREFAQKGTMDNVDNLVKVADQLSNGKFKEITTKRDELILNTDAAGRLARSYELAAPIRTGASTVKYDDQGRLIEGQRSDKQAFTVAQEVQTAVEQEQKQDLGQLERDRLGAAQSQTERARDFMSFFDPTGYATAAEADRSKLLHSYQTTDEERAFRLYESFANASAGITPIQPTYQNAGIGNQLISSGTQLAAGSLSSYGNTTRGSQNAGNTGYGATGGNAYGGGAR